MPKRIGKCTNYASCQLAFQNADIEAGPDFVCPECGQPLQDVTPAVSRRKPKNLILFGGIGLGVLVVIILAVLVLMKFGDQTGQKSIVENETSTPAVTPRDNQGLESGSPTSTPTPPPIFSVDEEEVEETPAAAESPTPMPTTTISPTPMSTATVSPTPTPAPTAEPREDLTPTVPDVFDRNPVSEENATTKEEVLKRVDLIPNLTDAQRDALYSRVNEARVMIKIILVPFGYAQKKLSADAIKELCDATNTPRVRELMQDPTVVFVVLGFADIYGSATSGLRLSTERAESVVDTLRSDCGVLNLMQPVGMGSSEFFGEKDKAKNRVAEVWAVLP